MPPPSDETEPAQDYIPIAPRKRRALIVHSPDAAAVGRAFDFDGSTWLLGRTVDGPGQIADTRISREHLRILPSADEQSYIVEDLGAKNGSFLNGKKIAQPTFVLGGHVIRLGDTLVVIDQD